MIKTLALAAALVLAPAAAQAQAAAATVPNPFDRPAGQPARPAAAPAAPRAATPVNAKSEDALRDLIAQAQGDGFDYALMTETLAEQVRAQEATVRPIIKGFGAIQALDFMDSQDGADIFAVTFAEADTLWVIGFDDAGKIDAFLFRPAPTTAAPAAVPATPAPAGD